MKFQREILTDRLEEMYSLLDQHYNELTLNKDKVKLDPDWDRYKELENKNKLYTYTIRSDNNELVGYGIFFVDTNIHYKSLLVASNDVLFLRQDLRKGMTGIKFLKYCESELIKAGVNKITWHVKHAKDIRPILHRLGYSDEDIIVGKII